MKKLIFFFSVCCILYSCNNYKYHDLPQDKMPLLKNNDIVYFKDSVSSKIDTFCLDVNNIWHQDTEGDFFRYIEIYYNKLNTKSTFLQINITSSSPDGAAFSVLFSKSIFNTGLNTINLNLNGFEYPNVYEVIDNTVLPTDTIPNIVYFTYPNGIISYKYNDGRVYQLVSK